MKLSLCLCIEKKRPNPKKEQPNEDHWNQLALHVLGILPLACRDLYGLQFPAAFTYSKSVLLLLQEFLSASTI